MFIVVQLLCSCTAIANRISELNGKKYFLVSITHNNRLLYFIFKMKYNDVFLCVTASRNNFVVSNFNKRNRMSCTKKYIKGCVCNYFGVSTY